jgi:hypothetical protein
MLGTCWKIGCGLLALAVASCASTATEKSTGTNWITCKTDLECGAIPGARCSTEGICVDANGTPIEKSALGGHADAAAGAGGTSGKGGTHADSGHATGGSGGNGGRLLDSGPGGSGNGGAPSDSGVDGSGAVTGVDGGAAPVSSCYSPGQNFDHAYDPGAVGCRCSPSAPEFCVRGVGLVCADGRWQLGGYACTECWTPDQPELAIDNPFGCSCVHENETACMFTTTTGYATALCTGGIWTRRLDINACSCASDARCGYGSRCGGGTCAQGVCDVDGLRYAAGTTGIADPVDCNTCECKADGTLSCSTLPCPFSSCPAGTSRSETCIQCGPAGGCAVTRTGCLPSCRTSADCSGTGTTTYCNPVTHVCGEGPCD